VTRQGMTVGELAKRTGVSVRALHHYEEVGLLQPARRTAAGYRLYGEAEVARLQQIRSLRQLGFGLDEIRHCLGRPECSALRVVELHLARTREQIEALGRLSRRLEAIAAGLRARPGAAEVSMDDLLSTIEEMTKVERYYTPEQLEELAERRRQIGDEGIRRAEADWQDLIARVRAEMEKGTDPTSEPVRQLAAQWKALVEAFTGGNPEIARSLGRMWEQEETIQGLNTREMREMMEYVSKAWAAPSQ
jgi:MerR family transcriptional regulator, thiopeptide resistance regulator